MCYSSCNYFANERTDLQFLFYADDMMPATYCEIDLDKEKRDAFVYAIKNHYWYQMYIDDLPIWGKYCMLFLKFGEYLDNKQDLCNDYSGDCTLNQ